MWTDNREKNETNSGALKRLSIDPKVFVSAF